MNPFIPHTLPIDKSNWNIDKILNKSMLHLLHCLNITGRILIPFYLWVRKRLPSPMLYISEFLGKNRDE